MFTHPHSSSAVRLSVLTPLVPLSTNDSSPSPSSSSSSGESSRQAHTPVRPPPPQTPPRSRPRTVSLNSPSHTRLRNGRARSYTANMPLFAAVPQAGPSSISASRAAAATSLRHLELGSPPPYSPEPPEVDPNSPFLAKRAASSPLLQSPSPSSHSPRVHPQPHTASSSSALHTHQAHSRAVYARVETDDDDTDTASGDDAVVYRSKERERPREREHEQSFAATLRERLFGRGKGRADAPERVRFITTAPGMAGAGETETESDDVPRNLPTARLTPSASLSTLSPLAESMTIPIPSTKACNKPRALALGPVLFEFSRLLSIVPAVFGTLWNIYHTVHPPDNNWCWACEYAVCVLWSVLTGWQCLQLTTGLFKRWRVYYPPPATLIRLFALQAICWPATHLTLTFLDHEARPLICWAAIGTTTCCSRSIQMWVTSNIVDPPHARTNGAASPELQRRYHRRWNWNAVLRECALPAGIVYFVMAWVLALRHEFDMCE